MSAAESRKSTSRALTMPDAALVKDCLKGKQEAWKNLILKYKNLIYSVPIRLGLSHDDAAEVFQSVCFDLVTELESLRDPQALPAWLIRVAYHKSLRCQREKERYVGTEPGEDSGPTEDGSALEDLTRDVGQAMKLREAIAGLSPRCQELIRRLFFDSPPQPYDTIAVTMGLARGSIAFMRSRCLNKLRSRLERAGFIQE